MENLTQYLYHVCSIFIFCMALALLLFMNKELTKCVITTKKQIKNVNTLYEQEQEDCKEDVISYYELISSLCCELHYDVQIDEIIIYADNYSYHNYDFRKIRNTNYSKSYILDIHGNIKRIIYRSN